MLAQGFMRTSSSRVHEAPPAISELNKRRGRARNGLEKVLQVRLLRLSDAMFSLTVGKASNRRWEIHSMCVLLDGNHF